MAGLVPNIAKAAALQAVLESETYSLRLFTNDYTPVVTSATADFTEAAFAGYGAVTLLNGSWVYLVGDPSTAAYPIETFTSTDAGAVDVFGYFITKLSDGTVFAAERFTGGAFSISSATAPVTVTLDNINLS